MLLLGPLAEERHKGTVDAISANGAVMCCYSSTQAIGNCSIADKTLLAATAEEVALDLALPFRSVLRPASLGESHASSTATTAWEAALGGAGVRT